MRALCIARRAARSRFRALPPRRAASASTAPPLAQSLSDLVAAAESSEGAIDPAHRLVAAAVVERPPLVAPPALGGPT